MSIVRSISSAVQKDALACLYICQMSSCSMGKRTKWCEFSCRSGSRGKSLLGLVFFGGVGCSDGVEGRRWAVLAQYFSQL